ncbi:MAG: glutathione S-transferase family protein [Gammaproteobacteria bacterium]|nr:glutathione S-transferase family protein [Gammaproteobacteria bacterium]MDH3768188.1 glutathione S-transferase family protein [Gammaproteobacteria bacterium]
MSVFIYGPPQSTYVRTVRMACTEKGVPYELKDVEFGSTDHTSLHPFARIPILRHRDFILCESSAITRYIDQVFEGPRLRPEDPRERGLMNQWISTVMDYYYDVMIRSLVLPRLGLAPLDEKKIAALRPRLEHQLGVADKALAENRHLACEALTLADLYLAPVIAFVMKTPEGGRAVPGYENLVRWMKGIMERQSFSSSVPPL